MRIPLLKGLYSHPLLFANSQYKIFMLIFPNSQDKIFKISDTHRTRYLYWFPIHLTRYILPNSQDKIFILIFPKLIFPNSQVTILIQHADIIYTDIHKLAGQDIYTDIPIFTGQYIYTVFPNHMILIFPGQFTDIPIHRTRYLYWYSHTHRTRYLYWYSHTHRTRYLYDIPILTGHYIYTDIPKLLIFPNSQDKIFILNRKIFILIPILTGQDI